MSYSDFLIVTGNNNVSSYLTGSALLNSTLSNPLTSSNFCRVFNLESLDNNRTRANFFISSSVNSGSFVNILDNKSVSLRAWVRSTGAENGVCLLAKHDIYNNCLLGIQSSSKPRVGYEFGYTSYNYSNTNGILYYEFGGYRTNIVMPYDSTWYARKKEQIGQDIWLGLRMDIVPVKAQQIVDGNPVLLLLKDIVTLYTASVTTPDNWVEIYNTEILTSDDRFVPWGSYSVLGGVQGALDPLISTSSYGFSVYGSNYSTLKVYIDDFKMYVTNAFT